MTVLRSLPLVGALFFAPLVAADMDWATALEGDHRKAGNADRNEFRHPRETLEFFGLEPDMAVMEVSPGGGWYTEVLAPLVTGEGKLIAAHYSPNGGGYARRSLGNYLAKLDEGKNVYADVHVSFLQPPIETAPAPASSVDLAVAFRNVHSWMRMSPNQAPAFFDAIYTSLKPGGVLGVVQHRAKPGTELQAMKDRAYVTETQVIEYAEGAGFVLVASSEINANPKDTKDHPKGVWNLPPALTDGEENKAEYLAIGESDRMTLKFQKPAE